LRDVLTTFDDEVSDDLSLRGPYREKNLSIPAAAGFFFSLDASSGLLATRRSLGRRVILPPCAQLLWRELYVMKDTKKKKKKKNGPSNPEYDQKRVTN